MATVDGNSMTVVVLDVMPSANQAHFSTKSGNLRSFTVTYYKMRARDVDCGSLTYRTWVVSGVPDPTGALYAGARCGVTALADVIIAETWQV